MSNVQSYNALIDRFKAFASGHFILKTFSHGQIDTADLEKFTEYPFMHVVPSNVTYAKGTKTFSFQIVLADLPRDKDDKVEFQREVLSDLQRIAEDLVAEITNHRVLFGDLITVQNVTLEPFLEEFHNTLTGWTVSLDLLVPYYWDACSIPAEWNDFFESGSGGTGSILTFIDSIVRDNNGNVSLVNDEAEPAANYYYGTNNEGVRGWYLLSDEVGLTCETIGDCQTIIDIEAAIDALEEEIVLKADITSISAVGFSNDYDDLDNKPTIPAAQVNSDWNSTSGVSEILNKPTLTNGTVTSVGLTMPSAFSVANSPITSSGDIAVTGAGVVSQYVRGDGSLANFPTSTGGGSSLAFYLNGSVAQGTFGGIAFKEMDRTPVFGAGTDFTINANGYIQSFITDANVPNLLEIPAGNWNFETYFSASSNGGSPSFYVELYKWDGVTLSLIASNSATPEGITNGTAIDLYVSALAVPQTTLALTDRLAVRIYVTHSGRTIKLHTENSHLCEVITTFSTGLTALNGLTAQVQNFATGTSGTDFAISSATSTHTFNLPTASAANRGALSSADWTTFNSKLSGLTVGTTAIASGTVGRVLFQGTGNVLQQSANIFWDNTNSRLGIGTASPAAKTSIVSTTALTGLYVENLGSATSPSAVFKNNQNASYASIDILGGSLITNSNKFQFGQYSTGDSFFFLVGNNNLDFFTNSVNRIRIFGGGNVGIGTTTDAGFKLDVNGTARVSGTTTITPAALTGTAATSALDIAQTWNTTGTPIALKVNITDTASAALSDLISLQVGGSVRFRVLKSGYFSHNTGGEIQGSLVVGSASINASAVLQSDSVTKGFLPPRMTTTQKNAIATPAAGLVVYDTTLGKLCVRGAAAWETITSL